MTRLLARTLIAATVMTALWGCSDDNEYNYTAPSKVAYGYFGLMADGAGEQQPVDANASIALTCNYSAMRATLQLTGAPMPDGSAVTYTFTDLPLTITGHTSSMVDVTGVSPDGVPGVVFDRLTVDFIDRDLGKEYLPVVDATYTVGGRTIRLVPKRYYYVGTTQVTGDDGTVYRTSAPQYVVTFFPAQMTANLEMRDAKFAQEMEKKDIRLEGLAVSFSADKFGISSEGVIPMIGQTAYPDFKVSALVGTGTYMGAMSVAFTVHDRGSVSAQLNYKSSDSADDTTTDNLFSATSTDLFTLVTEDDGSTAIYPGGKLNLTVNTTSSKATVKLTDVYRGGGEVGTFTLSNLPVSRQQGGLVFDIKGKDVKPDGIPTVTFNSVSLLYTQRNLDGQSRPLLYGLYSINGSRPVTLVPDKYYGFGRISLTDGDGTVTEYPDGDVTVTLYADGTATVTVKSLPLASDGSMTTLIAGPADVSFLSSGFEMSGQKAGGSGAWSVDELFAHVGYGGSLELDIHLTNARTGATYQLQAAL